MYRSATQAAPRRILSSRTILQKAASRRCLSTAPPTKKSRSWKSSGVRWGLAAGGIYYYNTSNLFAEEPEAAIQRLDDSIHHIQDSSLPTVDAIVEEKRLRQAQRIAEEEKQESAAKASLAGEEEAAEGEDEGGLEGLEDEAGQQGAFNPETGEINWDCPCLGGMAHGPCGEEFKTAFSCFVYSKEEVKGVECIDKFKGMQDCFRQHPETYASEFEEDEEEVEDELRARESASSEEVPVSSKSESAESPKPSPVTPEAAESKPVTQPHRDSSDVTAHTTTAADDEPTELLPKSVHDAT